MYDNNKGYWNTKKGIIKQKFPFISDEDLNFHEGKEVEMIEMLGYKLGKTKDEMRLIVDSLLP